MRCPKCGKEISNNSKYCQFCGYNLNLSKYIISFILVLFIIIICYGLIKHKIETKNKDILSITGIHPERFLEALYYARNLNPRTTMELNNFLRENGYEDLVPYFYFNENHEVIVSINHNTYTPDNLFESPRKLTREESIKFMQGK